MLYESKIKTQKVLESKFWHLPPPNRLLFKMRILINKLKFDLKLNPIVDSII